MAALTVWIAAWGSYVDLLNRYALPSFASELPEGSRVVLCSRSSDGGAARAAVEAHLPNVEIEDIVDRDHALFETIKSAHDRGHRMLIGSPDVIFGRGSVANMIALSDIYPGVTIGAAHVRVDRVEFERLRVHNLYRMTNRSLVSDALRVPHQTLASSGAQSDNSTMIGGISGATWSKHVGLIHHLPTPWLISPRASDVEYFRTHPMPSIDHHWPSVLVDQQRFLVPGSSDIAFAIELTAAGANNCPVRADSRGQKTFSGRNAHNLACGSFLVHLVGLDEEDL